MYHSDRTAKKPHQLDGSVSSCARTRAVALTQWHWCWQPELTNKLCNAQTTPVCATALKVGYCPTAGGRVLNVSWCSQHANKHSFKAHLYLCFCSRGTVSQFPKLSPKHSLWSRVFAVRVFRKKTKIFAGTTQSSNFVKMSPKHRYFPISSPTEIKASGFGKMNCHLWQAPKK